MDEFVVLNKSDMKNLKNDKPVKVRLFGDGLFSDERIFTLCTDKYFQDEVIKEKKDD